MGAGERVGKLKSHFLNLVLTSFPPELLPELLISFFHFSVQILFRELIDRDKKGCGQKEGAGGAWVTCKLAPGP